MKRPRGARVADAVPLTIPEYTITKRYEKAAHPGLGAPGVLLDKISETFRLALASGTEEQRRRPMSCCNSFDCRTSTPTHSPHTPHANVKSVLNALSPRFVSWTTAELTFERCKWQRRPWGRAPKLYSISSR